jgi:hypothetical protein
MGGEQNAGVVTVVRSWIAIELNRCTDLGDGQRMEFPVR